MIGWSVEQFWFYCPLRFSGIFLLNDPSEFLSDRSVLDQLEVEGVFRFPLLFVHTWVDRTDRSTGVSNDTAAISAAIFKEKNLPKILSTEADFAKRNENQEASFSP